jgi:hypothetical protein
MRISNVLPGVLILALSAAIFIDTRHLTYWSDTTPGPGFFPYWVILAGVALFLLQLSEAWRAGGEVTVEWPDRPALIRATATYGGLVALAALTPVLGMILSIVLFVMFLLFVILRQPLWPSLVATTITIGLIYVIFVRWLGTALPTSALGL